LYRKNPFHSFEHASHVTMSVIKLMTRIVAPSDLDLGSTAREKTIHEGDENAADKGRLQKEASSLHDHTYGITSDPLTQFACAFTALIHDVDHTGVPNQQLISENPRLAAIYKNRSVAEQNSLSLSWDLLMDERFENLRNTIFSTKAELCRFRELVVNAVMATDIVDKDLKVLRNERWNKAFETTDNSNNNNVGNVAADSSRKGRSVSAKRATRDGVNRKATIVIEHLIQASDVAHTMQHWHVYRKWNERLFHELYAAYRSGRAGSNPADFWAKGEVMFFDHYVIPLAKKLKNCGVFGVSSDEYLNYAISNRQEWIEKGDTIVADMVSKLSDQFEASSTDTEAESE